MNRNTAKLLQHSEYWRELDAEALSTLAQYGTGISPPPPSVRYRYRYPASQPGSTPFLSLRPALCSTSITTTQIRVTVIFLGEHSRWGEVLYQEISIAQRPNDTHKWRSEKGEGGSFGCEYNLTYVSDFCSDLLCIR